jgi:hypothetical protein
LSATPAATGRVSWTGGKTLLTSEQKAMLYTLRLIRLRWDDENDYRGLVFTLNAMKEKKMLRLLDLILLPGKFREVVMFTLQQKKKGDVE